MNNKLKHQLQYLELRVMHTLVARADRVIGAFMTYVLLCALDLDACSLPLALAFSLRSPSSPLRTQHKQKSRHAQ